MYCILLTEMNKAPFELNNSPYSKVLLNNTSLFVLKLHRQVYNSMCILYIMNLHINIISPFFTLACHDIIPDGFPTRPMGAYVFLCPAL